MPDRTGHIEFKVAEVHIPPTQGQEFAYAKAGASVEQRERSFSNAEFAEQELNFNHFENIRNALPFRALPNELDRISICPFVSHCVCEECAHEVPNLGSCALSPLDPVQPLFDCYGLHLFERVISPARKNPVLQVAFIGRSRRERFSPVTITASHPWPIDGG